MKIAFAGDWHANWRWARQAIEHAAAQGARTILHLGDYGYDFSPDFCSSIEATLRRTGLTLQFVDGNHEDFNWLYSQPVGKDGRRKITERVHHLPRGYRWEWGGVRFLAVGGAFSVDRKWRTLAVGGAFLPNGKRRAPDSLWWPEETLTDDDTERACAAGPVDVLIAHDCPDGPAIPGLARTAHLFPAAAIAQSEDHRRRLREVVDVVKPRTILHGHYHIPYTTVHDFGYGPTVVHGLDADGTSLRGNVSVIDVLDVVQIGHRIAQCQGPMHPVNLRPACPIHNPGTHRMATWPLNWDESTGVMRRRCSHGFFHPDPDHLAYIRWRKDSDAADKQQVHACDSCCTAPGGDTA